MFCEKQSDHIFHIYIAGLELIHFPLAAMRGPLWPTKKAAYRSHRMTQVNARSASTGND